MSEPNNSGLRVRKRKGSSKSSTKSNKRKASTIEIKQEPIGSSPSSKELELPKTEISPLQETSLNDHLQLSTNPTLGPPINDPLSKDFTKGLTNLTNIPNEIFVQICAHLPPNDLLSLTLVCRQLNELLCSPKSEQTQAIWRNSRVRFLRFFQLNPPPGLDEKSYIILRKLENGCQICHRKIGCIKVYWEFFVRCCESCLVKNTIRRDYLYIDLRLPDEILRTLPHIFLGASHVYWTKDVERAINEYNTLREEDIPYWVEHKEKIAFKIMHEAESHEQEEYEEQVSLTQPSNDTPQQISIPQQQILIRQPQFTTASMNFVSMSSMSSLSGVSGVSSVPTVPSMGLTSQLQQFNRSQMIIPQIQGVTFNRSQFMIQTPPSQQFYSHPHFVPRITRQLISQQHQQQVIPSHMIAGAPHMLTPQIPQMLTPRLPQMLTPQVVSPPMVSPPMISPPMISPPMVSPMVSPQMVSPQMVSPQMLSPQMMSPRCYGIHQIRRF